jgi:hypothetical protein
MNTAGWRFGDVSEPDHCDALWDEKGDLLVVQASFCEGEHRAYHVGDFEPIIRQILELHQQGFVHGDLRFFNIVLRGKDGSLIDFDLGGRIGEVTFPKGYRFDLPDGDRFGKPGELILEYHDWYAFVNALEKYHDFHPPAYATSRYDRHCMRDALDDIKMVLKEMTPGVVVVDEIDFGTMLLDFVQEYGEWKCTPTTKYASTLEENPSGRATGTPLKK